MGRRTADRADLALHLTLLPTRGRIAELGREHIVVRHRQEPDVDLPLLAASDPVDRRAHVVVNAALRHAAEDTEPVPMGVKQHLVGLQQIGAQQERPAVRQLDVRNLKLCALAAQSFCVRRSRTARSCDGA